MSRRRTKFTCKAVSPRQRASRKRTDEAAFGYSRLIDNLSVGCRRSLLWVFLIVLFIAFGIPLISLCLVGTIPDRTLTRSSMQSLRVHIVNYYNTNKQLPDTLDELDLDSVDLGHIRSDAWGRPIKYSYKDGLVVLSSQGEDGEPGGDGDDEDILLKFDPTEDVIVQNPLTP